VTNAAEENKEIKNIPWISVKEKEEVKKKAIRAVTEVGK
jgi:hypothetical protein